MANFLRFTRDRAVIVEGYAAAGTLDQQFLLSRERATKVRDYLLKKFTLSPDYVGVMPMGAVSEYGDGIALVLLKK
jgi:outer membrane protein OmpA-like peptidoglycan-associated protein